MPKQEVEQPTLPNLLHEVPCQVRVVEAEFTVPPLPYIPKVCSPVDKTKIVMSTNVDTIQAFPPLPYLPKESDSVDKSPNKISEGVCIELCAGSAGLSAKLRNKGFQVVPIDWSGNRHRPKVKSVAIDLSKPEAFKLVHDLILTGKVVYVHMGPPCGTATKARERRVSQALKAAGAPDPQPLRSLEWPWGLPGLTGLSLQKVITANKIYALTVQIAKLCLHLDILVSIENPRGSYYWELPPVVELRKDPRMQDNDMQNCMHGSERDKWSRWLATKHLLVPMQLKCDNSHSHKAWGFLPGPGWHFATAEEAEYPDAMCESVADLVYKHCLNKGYSAVPHSLAEGQMSSEQTLLARRAAVGKQPRGRKLPPLLPEFAMVEETLDKPSKDDKSCRLLRQFYRKGPDESQQLWYVVGRYAEPEVFLQQAIEVQHPLDSLCTVDDITKRALFDILYLGPVGLSRKRLRALEEMEAMRKHLEVEEAVLHGKLPPNQRKVLEGKNLLLFQSLLIKTGYGDKDLVKDMQGFDLTGVAKPSGVLPTRIKPATITTNELRARSAITRRSIISACGSSGDSGRDAALFAKTLEERDSGWLRGPFSEQEVTEQLGPSWVPSRRFGLQQSDKLRPIDDASEPGINDALMTTEKLQLHDLDVVVETLKYIQDCVVDKNIYMELSTGEVLQGSVHEDWPDDLEWLGRTLDLMAAYKNLPISEESKFCSVIVLFDPVGMNPVFMISDALLFGCTSAVYAFNRVARALHHSATVLLSLVVHQFYDDFPSAEPKRTSALAKQTFEKFLKLLGWPVSRGDKDLAFAPEYPALGALVDLAQMTQGYIGIKNKPKRVANIVAQLRDIRSKGSLKRALAAEVVGKIRYAGTHVCGRLLVQPLMVLTSATGGNPFPTGILMAAIDEAITLLEKSQPRVVRRTDRGRRAWIIFTDGSFENGIGRWGIFLLDPESGRSWVAGGLVPDSLIEVWRKTVGEQLIAQVEFYPILLIRARWSGALANRKVLYFIDNDSVRFGLIRGVADSPILAVLVHRYFLLEATSSTFPWYARVASHSNIADAPSRGRVDVVAELFSAQIINDLCFTPFELNELCRACYERHELCGTRRFP